MTVKFTCLKISSICIMSVIYCYCSRWLGIVLMALTAMLTHCWHRHQDHGCAIVEPGVGWRGLSMFFCFLHILYKISIYILVEWISTNWRNIYIIPKQKMIKQDISGWNIKGFYLRAGTVMRCSATASHFRYVCYLKTV